MEPIQALERATEQYRQRLAAVAVDQWDQPSVCDAWTVKDLADHVLGGNRFALPLLAGASPDEAFTQALAPGFDGDPVARFDESASAQIEAFGREGALAAVIHHPAGDIDGRAFLGFRAGDLLLHGWDLARSTGGDDHLDEELLPDVWQAYEPVVGAGVERGIFGAGPSGDVPADAPLALRLLDLTGRRP
jgi:uncharacterized protein (TIGR03086 family)